MKTESAPFCKRAHERVRVAWPVRMAGLRGWTRDISDEGVFFELEEDVEFDREIDFELDMNTRLGRMCMSCRGKVVRAERVSGRIGIATRLLDSNLEAIRTE